MDGNRRLSLVVGIFVLLSLGALAVTILSLSSQEVVSDTLNSTVSPSGSSRGPKGPIEEVARCAGLLAAKRTAELIPMCHPLALEHVEVLAPSSLRNHIVERLESTLALYT